MCYFDIKIEKWRNTLNDYIGLAIHQKPRVVAVLNQKGGVGKTTVSTNIASNLYLDGERVLLVDSDKQGSARDWGAAGNTKLPILGFDRPSLEKDLKKIWHHYDWIIIDGVGKLEEMSKCAIKCADLVIIPVQPSPYDLWGSADLIEVIQARWQVTEDKPKAYFCVSRKIPNTSLDKDFRKVLEETGLPSLKGYTSQREVYKQSAARGESVFDACNKKAIDEITNIVNEIKEILR